MATSFTHKPVLVEPLLDMIKPKRGEIYLDLTAGLGGHAKAFLKHTSAKKQAVLVDQDLEAVKRLEEDFKASRVMHQDFLGACQVLISEGFKADIIVIDLGLSSMQLEDGQRGFSFQRSAELDMRMNPQGQHTTAANLVNRLNQVELANLIFLYGQEGRSRQIARAIVQSRPIHDTLKLAEVVTKAVGGKRGKIHPATRTFQALRIAVNDELGQLKAVLPLLTELLTDGGRVGVISFHSLEDREVKLFLKQSQDFQPLTKKPISGQEDDISNPRARSAKLRIARKIKKPNNKKGE